MHRPPLLLFLSALAAATGFASEPEAWTLGMAVRAAGRSLGARITAAESEAESWRAATLAAVPENPSVEGTFEAGHAEVEVAIPLDPSGVARGRWASAAADLSRVEDLRSQAEWRATVALRWVDARWSADRQATGALAFGEAEALVDAVSRALAAGERTADELVFSKAEWVERWAAAESRTREAEAARRWLERSLGLDPKQGLGPWPAAPARPSPEEAGSLDRAAARRIVEVAAAESSVEGASVLPSIEARIGVGLGPAPAPRWGFRIELPLFAPGLAAARATVAESRRAALQAARVDDEQAGLWEAAVAQADLARATFERWSDVDAAIVRDGARRRFEAGESSLVEYLGATRRAAELDDARLDAQAEHLRSELLLWALAGAPLEALP